MKTEPGTTTKSWYLCGVLIWRVKRTLTLEEQVIQTKGDILRELSEEIDKIVNPNAHRKNVEQ